MLGDLHASLPFRGGQWGLVRVWSCPGSLPMPGDPPTPSPSSGLPPEAVPPEDTRWDGFPRLRSRKGLSIRSSAHDQILRAFNTKSSGKRGDRNSHACLLPYGSGDQQGGYPGETNKQSFIHPFKYPPCTRNESGTEKGPGNMRNKAPVLMMLIIQSGKQMIKKSLPKKRMNYWKEKK